MNAANYLERIDLPATATDQPADRALLARLIEAHCRTVPFENLAIVGDPHGAFAGDGVTLAVPALYEKVVEERRGGFCFELNGLCHWLLTELGYDADRCAARIGGDEETLGRPPANHHTTVVTLDREYLVDVGTGCPQVRTPVPLDGSVVEDPVGIEWRIDPAEMALSDYALSRREPGSDWQLRYRFQREPRKLSFFAATCDFLANEPDGTFTSGPIVQRSTADGYLRMDAGTLTRVAGGEEREEREEPVAPEEWAEVLAREFRIELRTPAPDRNTDSDRG